MPYNLLADLVVLTHLAFVLFVVLGGLLALRWPWMPWLHLPAAAWGVLIEATGWICPLTPFENRLRRAGGGPVYEGDFVQHYVLPILYPAGLTRELQIGLRVFVVAMNAGVYAIVWRRRRTTAAGAALRRSE